MPSIGETLREARMRQRLDIADVEDRTKIRAKYLRALENEEFGMLPGPTFVKTFLRTYAEALGLDPQLLVEDYRATYESGDEIEQAQSLGPPSVSRARRSGPRLGPGTALLLVLVGVVALLVAIGLAAGTGDDGGDDAGTPQTNTTPQNAGQQKRKNARPRRVVLRITPLTPTYVCVDHGAGSRVVYEDTLSGSQVFRGKRVRINLGKTDVRLRMNGKLVPVDRGPNPVGYLFTPRGSRPLAFGQRPCA